MRWIAYAILAYIAVGLQTGLAGYTDVYGAPPSLILLAVIFIAVNAPREPALVGGFVLGVLQDLLTQAPLGLYAFSYGLVAMFVVSTQEIVYREHPLTHFSLALTGALMTGGILVLHGLVRTPRVSLVSAFTGAVYTALLAPFVLWALQRVKRLFAFEPARRRTRGR
jgi:rod shape-determining protein MreD